MLDRICGYGTYASELWFEPPAAFGNCINPKPDQWSINAALAVAILV
jgi:hypothetical protein